MFACLLCLLSTRACKAHYCTLMAQCLQPWLGAFSIFCYYFSILMAISVFLIFLTGVTSNSRRWEVVKISMSLKRPFFYLPGVSGVACSVLFRITPCKFFHNLYFLACRTTFKLHSSVSIIITIIVVLLKYIMPNSERTGTWLSWLCLTCYSQHDND